jgi:hypothetical protein
MYDRLKRLIDEMENVSNVEACSDFEKGYLSANKETSKKLKMILLDLMDDMR